MEYLRWILLLAGLVFILVVYLVSRSRKQQDSFDNYETDDELPEFSARDWDELDEGVGRVRVIASAESEDDFQQTDNDLDNYTDDYDKNDDIGDSYAESELKDANYQVNDQTSDQSIEQQPEADQQSNANDIIVIYVLARASSQLSGDKINSAAQANGLAFGKMNVFHRFDEQGNSLFSLANMVEPGNFDPDNMHELQTSGIIFFMQISAVADPDRTFDEMLECAYHVSEMLDAQLCNHKRQPLTQQDADYYRDIVAGAHA